MILPSERADARMRMFNADGSEGEMCGNGVRCVAKYVHDHGIARRPQVTIETGRGVLTLDLEVDGGRAQRVRVDMQAPILQASEIPTTLPGDPPIDAPLRTIDGQTLRRDRRPRWGTRTPWSMSTTSRSSRWSRMGPLLENHPTFPKRVNVHFVEVVGPNEVRMRTWERGSGITLACGTGACAVCVAGVLTGRTERKIVAHLPGGDLELEWPGDGQSVFMTGPATEVFSGRVVRLIGSPTRLQVGGNGCTPNGIRVDSPSAQRFKYDASAEL